MRAMRREAYELRTGRRQPFPGSTDADLSRRRSATAAYEALLAQLARRRAALTSDGSVARPLAEVRLEHAKLERCLADAVARAFAAEALEAPTPEGIDSWVAEGLARSLERELALLTVSDISGLLPARTVPGPRWGVVDVDQTRPGGDSAGAGTPEEEAEQ